MAFSQPDWIMQFSGDGHNSISLSRFMRGCSYARLGMGGARATRLHGGKCKTMKHVARDRSAKSIETRKPPCSETGDDGMPK